MRTALFVAILCIACGGGNEGTDGGGGGVDARVAGDGAMPTDAPGGCGTGEHDCSGTCTPDGFNDPATGCRLGCGDPCPNLTMATCNADGSCGIIGCTPMMCPDLGVECGLVDDGCGRRINCGMCDGSVGQHCVMGACVCDLDPNEPNESRSGLSDVTSIDDSVEPPPFTIDGTIHIATDEDWYQVRIVDGSDGGSPVITIELMTPVGWDYEVAAYFACTDTSGTNTTSCSSGTNDDSIEQGCTTAGLAADLIVMDTSCGGVFTDENGTLWIRVRAATWTGMCGGYTVQVSGM